MPCYDGRDNNCHQTSSVVYESNPDDKKTIANLKKIIDEITEVNKKLEAGLCAILSELENDSEIDDLLARAGKRGQIDLIGFWIAHRNSDEMRLSRELNKFSEHEKSVIKKLLQSHVLD